MTTIAYLSRLRSQLKPSVVPLIYRVLLHTELDSSLVSKAHPLNNRCFIHIYFTSNKTRQLEQRFTIAAGSCIYIER